MSESHYAWIPNGLTVMRFVMGVALPWSPGEWQFGMLAIAGFSDLIDGWIGRRLGVTSGFGQIADPIADKTLMFAAVFTALRAGWLSWTEVLALAARDVTVLVLSGIVLAHGRSHWRKLTPRISGKIATAGQIATLLALFWFRQALPAILWTAAALSIVSALDYTWRAYRADRS